MILIGNIVFYITLSICWSKHKKSIFTTFPFLEGFSHRFVRSSLKTTMGFIKLQTCTVILPINKNKNTHHIFNMDFDTTSEFPNKNLRKCFPLSPLNFCFVNEFQKRTSPIREGYSVRIVSILLL